MNKEDIKYTLIDDKGNKYYIIQTDKIDAQKHFNKELKRYLNVINLAIKYIKEHDTLDKDVLLEILMED